MRNNIVLKRIFFILIIAIVINSISSNYTYAMSNVISAGKEFLEKGQLVEEVIEIDQLQTTSNFIFNMFLVVAIVLAVGVGTVLGIKFMTSSVDEQAKIKEAVVPYIVGCMVIFSAFPIWSFIVNAGQDVTGVDPNADKNRIVSFVHSPNGNYWFTKTGKHCRDCVDTDYTETYTVGQLYEYRNGPYKKYKTKMAQCKNCWSITVFDTSTYEGTRLEWAKCIQCEEYIQLKLEDLEKYDIEPGNTFKAVCGKGHADLYYFEKSGVRIIVAPDDYKLGKIKESEENPLKDADEL